MAVLGTVNTLQVMENEYFSKHNVQPFLFQKENIASFHSGIAMPKNFYSVKCTIDPIIGQLFDNGIIMKLFSKHVPPEGEL